MMEEKEVIFTNEITFNKLRFTKLYQIRLINDNVVVFDNEKGYFHDLMNEYFNSYEEAEHRLICSCHMFKGPAELTIETIYKKL